MSTSPSGSAAPRDDKASQPGSPSAPISAHRPRRPIASPVAHPERQRTGNASTVPLLVRLRTRQPVKRNITALPDPQFRTAPFFSFTADRGFSFSGAPEKEKWGSSSPRLTGAKPRAPSGALSPRPSGREFPRRSRARDSCPCRPRSEYTPRCSDFPGH